MQHDDRVAIAQADAGDGLAAGFVSFETRLNLEGDLVRAALKEELHRAV